MRESLRALKESWRGSAKGSPDNGFVVDADGWREIGGGKGALDRTGDGGGALVGPGVANDTPRVGVVVLISHSTRLASLRTLSSPTANTCGAAGQKVNAVQARLDFGLRCACGPRAAMWSVPRRDDSRRRSSTRPDVRPTATRSSMWLSGDHAKH